MGILSGNPKEEPLHYGEVFAIWTNLIMNNGLIAAYQTFYNHAGDDELKGLIEECVKSMEEENKQIEKILKVNAVGLPPAPPARPDARLEDIPVGARFNDPEICAALAKDSAAGLVACSKVMGESIREDIAMLYGQFHTAKVQIGAKILRLNKSKGWLVPPPLHHFPGKG
ncbi:DUF3231 family protein [Psychrobacillus psychrodurans]|uniref:DUF3231 family protein n=1 Tax=Psychrobacillus psychrodurans TaxID=126157 RepID=UPI001F4DD18A|nr:DUF3231 family protein [Psychrobacillus psychrodurans]MCK1996428.1 DUF3231 family protein [Psychrobacillus psychrodurans]